MFLQPDNVKSCTNCKAKKIKCSGELPICAKCQKTGVSCDIVDNVFYNYQTVQSLMMTVENLEKRVAESKLAKEQADPNISPHPQTLTSLNYPSPNKSETSGSIHSEKSKKETTIDDISTEVGSLTITNNSFRHGEFPSALPGTYFAELFLQQMHLAKIGDLANTTSTDNFHDFDVSVTTAYAPLPPYRISQYAVLKYINQVHIYYPLLTPQDLKTILNKMYSSPRDITIQEKFVLFMVISIGLDRSEDDAELANYKNQFKPVEYFSTAYRYLEQILSNRSEASLQALLLIIIWLLHTNIVKKDNGDLWHMGRFSMSLAMELGVHRFNPDWDFGELKNEMRNRLFWCTYILERTIAMKFIRGLSLRKQAIDTPLPKLIKDDYILDNSFIKEKRLRVYDQVQFKPSLLLINICEIYGDILETIYISPTTTVGGSPDISEVNHYKSQLSNTLTQWLSQMEQEIPNTLDCYHELKIRYCVTSVMLNRPSPLFITPDRESLEKCKADSQICVDSYTYLLNHGWKINPICVQDILNVGLAMIYCCWKTENSSTRLKEFSAKIIQVMNGIAGCYPSFSKFKNLYMIVSSVVIDGFDNAGKQQQPAHKPQHSNQNLSPHLSEPDFIQGYVASKFQSIKEGIQFPSTMISPDQQHNKVEFNDWFTQELFQDVFKHYYFNGNDKIMEDLDHLFAGSSYS